GNPIGPIAVKIKGFCSSQNHTSDIVHLEHFIFLISMQGIDVQFVSDILDQTPNLIRGMEYSVLSPDLNWSFVIKPAQHHLDILTQLGLVVGSDDHIPPD